MHAGVLAGTPTATEEAGNLASQLSNPREVLPYLLLMRGGFADWPLTRKALAQAARAVIRPRALAPQTAGAGARQDARAACQVAGARLLSPKDVGDVCAAEAMTALRPRLSRRLQPNDFIATS
jgi:hypothetical protein